MTLDEYQQLARRTAPSREDNFRSNVDLDSFDIARLHSVMGIMTESGELMDAIKKSIIYHKDLDTDNIQEELGDLMWYISLACDAFDLDLETILMLNIEKLKKRYPEKYTNKDALERKDKL